MEDPELEEIMKIVEKLLVMRAEQDYLQRALSNEHCMSIGSESKVHHDPQIDRNKVLSELKQKKEQIIKQLKN